MIHLTYLGALLISLGGMALIDWRYRLALFFNTQQTLITLAVGLGVFLLWDALGIGLDIFLSGDSRYATGIFLAPEFPLEELFFLLFLCYFTLVLFRFGETRWPRT